MRVITEFKVVAVSTNTNSFGLRQMIMISRDGTLCKGCFNYLNVKQKGDTIYGKALVSHSGRMTSIEFPGGELVEIGEEKTPKQILKSIFS